MAWYLYLLLMPILASSSQPTTANRNKNHQTQSYVTRQARSPHPLPQSFQTNFDPIPSDQVRDHFGLSDSGSVFGGNQPNLQRRQELFQKLRTQPSFSPKVFAQSPSLFPEINLQTNGQKQIPIRFPDPQDEDQLLLTVESFPEERLASRGDPVLTDFLKIQPKNSPNPLASVSAGQQRPRIHIPRQKVPDNNNRENFSRFNPAPSFTQSNVTPNPRIPQNNPISVTTKPILNPLLQKLFNRNSIPLSNPQTVQGFQQPPRPNPTVSSQRPSSVLLPNQQEPRTSQILETLSGSQQPSSETISLFERIKNRINENRRENMVQPTITTPNNSNTIKSGRSQTSLLRDQILSQKKQQAQAISNILKEENTSTEKDAQLEEKKRQFELLLAEKKEKERMLMEALVKQKAQQEILKRQREEDLRRKAEQEEEQKKIIEARKEEAIMKKEINEQREKEQRRLKQEPNKTNQEEKALVVVKAVEAVRKRTQQGNEKSSPAVWAAVKALSEFVETQESSKRAPNVPQHILMAIIQLTQFLNEGDKKTEDKEIPEDKKEESSLSPSQQRLRDQIIRQREQQAAEIANILKAETVESFMRSEQTNQALEPKKNAKSVPFPSRILPSQFQGSNESSPVRGSDSGAPFSFDTIPVL